MVPAASPRPLMLVKSAPLPADTLDRIRTSRRNGPMSQVLVLYHSYNAQTARIARRIGEVIQQAGHNQVLVQAFDGKSVPEIHGFAGVVVGAAIRYGHHERAFEKALRPHAVELAARPNAFFSVCLCAGGPGYKPEAARRYVEDFCKRTGWQPRETASFAGALQYSKYSPFIKLMMKLIVGFSGGETDDSRDYEYTDWAAVERFARDFAQHLAPAHRAAA
jgi:menaquinone-dependent protoporphyrinogen oxidase